MTIAEFPQIEIGQYVPIHQEKLLRQILNQRKRPDSAQRDGLKRVVNFEAPPRSIAKKGADQMGLMIYRHGDPPKSVKGELPNHNFQNRIFPNRHERLRKDNSIWAQPRSLATGKNHSPVSNCRHGVCTA